MSVVDVGRAVPYAMAWLAKHTHIARTVLSCNDTDLKAIKQADESEARAQHAGSVAAQVSPLSFPPALACSCASLDSPPSRSRCTASSFSRACWTRDAAECPFCAKRGLPRPGALFSEGSEGRAWPG